MKGSSRPQIKDQVGGRDVVQTQRSHHSDELTTMEGRVIHAMVNDLKWLLLEWDLTGRLILQGSGKKIRRLLVNKLVKSR